MDSPVKRTVRVTIYNQNYSLLSEGDPAEIEQVAQSVDELMTSIATRAGNIDSTRTAVLACLHLADRLRSLERELAEVRQSLDSKARHFTLLLDQAIE